MKRPSNMLNYPKRDLKLGIKSSLPNPRSAIGLLLLLWEISNKADKIEYAEEDNGVLKAKDSLMKSIKECPECNNLELNQLRDKIESNNLFTSQIEALIVAFELIWCLGKFEFSDGRPVNAERTGGKRFSKVILFTANMDIIDSAFSNNKSEFRKVLLKWIGFDVKVDTATENNLVRILTILSENSVYKLKDGSNDIIFNNLSIYNELRSDTEVDIKGDEEAKGSLRILLSELKDNLNANLKYENDKVVSNSENADELNRYAERVNTLLLLSNDKEQLQIAEKELSKINRNQLLHSHNRIIFGAPGTGKSHKLENDTKDFEDNISIKDSEESMVQIEIQESGNNYGKNFAIGLNHSEFFKNQKPKSIREKYNCSNDAAYTIAQGMRSVNLKSELVDLPDDKLTDDNIKIELEKLLTKKDLKQAGAALIGYMYSDALSGRTVSELADSFDLSKTGSLASWIQIGVQASEYKFDISKDNKSKRYERVTFHPNYSYAQFVGTYKPIQDRENKDNIRYEYIPGPFMRIYVNAKRNPEKNFLLLIEEINRANVAAVFGDVFQLLDRKSDGTSQYPIAASEDQKNYLESCGISEDEISIPSNMYIWATMNSADQGVLPMDAAFKRRWDFEYIGIDDNEDSIKDYVLPIPQKDSDGNISYTSENWNKIRHAINDKLKNIYGVNEDKLLGPYFLSKSTLDEAKQINCKTETDKAEKICSLFKSKVLMYLYEDVVKMNPTELFNKSVFSEDKPLHYSDLCNKFDELGLKIFDEDFVK